jgi:hypothetical protein
METETDGRAVFFRPNGGRVPSVPPVGSIPETALDQGLRAWRVQPDDWAHDIEPMSLDDALFILHKAEQRSGPLLN